MDGEFGGEADATCSADRATGAMHVTASAEQQDGPPVVVPTVTHAGAVSYAYLGDLLPSAPGLYRVTAVLEDVRWSASAVSRGDTVQEPIAQVHVLLLCTGSCVYDTSPGAQYFSQLTSCSGANISCGGSRDRLDLAATFTVLPEVPTLGPATARAVLSAGAYLYGGGGEVRASGSLVLTDLTITPA